MNRYVVLIDGEAGGYGVTVPDLPGCTAMGATMDEALINAAEALRDWVEITEGNGDVVPAPRTIEALRGEPEIAEALATGAALATVGLVRITGRPARANLSLDAGVLEALDREAKRQGLTRSAMVEALTMRAAAGTL